jgi:hypothetical protein
MKLTEFYTGNVEELGFTKTPDFSKLLEASDDWDDEDEAWFNDDEDEAKPADKWGDSDGSELDADDDAPIVKSRNEPVQTQIMKITDAVPDENVKNPLRTVVTDNGDTVRVEFEEAKAIMKLLTAEGVKPAVKIQLQKDIQTTRGLNRILDFVREHGMANS